MAVGQRHADAPTATRETGFEAQFDPRRAAGALFRTLRTGPDGISSREAERRLVAYGRNELRRESGPTWPRELLAQFTHPLALLLWPAAALAVVAGTVLLGLAIVAVIVLNAAFAFAQERQAERAVECPPRLPATTGDGASRRPAAVDRGSDARARFAARLPVGRVRRHSDPLIDARDLIFSGSSCLSGEATALVFATGMQTELGLRRRSKTSIADKA